MGVYKKNMCRGVTKELEFKKVQVIAVYRLRSRDLGDHNTILLLYWTK